LVEKDKKECFKSFKVILSLNLSNKLSEYKVNLLI